MHFQPRQYCLPHACRPPAPGRTTGIWGYALGLAVLLAAGVPLRAQDSLMAQPTTPRVVGMLKDQATGSALPFASVVLRPAGDSLRVTRGAMASETGAFQLDGLPYGQYDLVVSLLSYEPRVVPGIRLSAGKPVADLGVVQLAEAAVKLPAVEVTANAGPPLLENTLDGLRISASQAIAQTGGSALDLLRNAPSVRVGLDGKVKIRGAGGTNVLINGRNSGFGNDLSRIPASAIESIQIINNPDARFDAQGGGGLIDVKLKENSRLEKGTSGEVEMTAGTQHLFNGALHLNHRREKSSFVFGYSRRSRDHRRDAHTFRENTGHDSPRFLDQYRTSRSRDSENTLQFRAEFDLRGNHRLDLETLLGTEDRAGRQATESRWLNAGRTLGSSNLRTSVGREARLLLDQAVNYRRRFNRENQELTARLNLSYERRDDAGDLLTRAIPAVTGKTSPDLPDLERRRDGQRRLVGVFQVDYEHPFGSKAKVEAGLKSTFRRLDSDFLFENYVYALADYRNDLQVSNRFLYRELVHAAYAQYRQDLGRFALSLGGRAELSDIRTELLTTNEANGNRYLNFFPSGKVKYQFSAGRHVRFVYTRRIDRPGSGSLNPFPDLTDSLNIESGNPSLRPEFISSYELGFTQQWNRTMLAANLFYRNRRGIIEDITRLRPDGVSVERPENTGNGRVYGLELVGTAPLTDWWEMNASVTLFRNRLEGFSRYRPLVAARTSWSAKVNADLKLPFRTRLQATAHYTAPVVEAQGTEGGQCYADLGLRKRWLKQKSTIGLNVRDVFNTLRRRDVTYGPDFFQRRNTYVFQRIIQLSFAYRF